MRIYAAFILLFLTILCNKGYSQPSDSSNNDLKIFTKVDKEASFPGGLEAWKKFLEKNLNPNVPVDRGAPIGHFTVIAQFVVSRDGTLSDIKALTNLGYGMEQEVLRILRKSASWQPAMMDGKAVKAYRKQPVSFVVIDDGVDVSSYVVTEGQDNPITIKAKGVSDPNLKVVSSRGTITNKGDGNFIIHVNGTDRLILSVCNSKKNDKVVAEISLEVKQP